MFSNCQPNNPYALFQGPLLSNTNAPTSERRVVDRRAGLLDTSGTVSTLQMQLTERLLNIVAAYPKATVLGVGDLMLDQYRRGKAVGLSPEAPAIELLNPRLTATPGGAANVAWNIGYLGGRVRMIGVIGTDSEGRTLRTLLAETPGVTVQAIEDLERPTTLKLRYYHEQFQVLRVSQESNVPLSSAVADRARQTIHEQLDGCGAVFVEDYGKQLINPALVDTFLTIRKNHPELPIVLDPKIGNHHVYRAGMCTLLKPNWTEACALIQQSPDQADPATVARLLSDVYDCDVLITRGSAGACAYERARGHAHLIPTRAREAFDIAGAGDTTLAVIVLSLAAGASLHDAAVLANLAAGMVVEKSGTAYVTPEELVADLGHPKTRALLAAMSERLAVPAARAGT